LSIRQFISKIIQLNNKTIYFSCDACHSSCTYSKMIPFVFFSSFLIISNVLNRMVKNILQDKQIKTHFSRKWGICSAYNQFCFWNIYYIPSIMTCFFLLSSLEGEQVFHHSRRKIKTTIFLLNKN
jgi:hypothetical protein